MFHLDTNACIRVLNGTSPALVSRLKTQAPAEIAIATIVMAELHDGARRSRRVADNLRLLERFFAPFASIPFDARCSEQYGAIRADLAKSGSPIGPNDLLIAATARAHDATLVSHNVGEFSRVVGLRVEDWE